MNCLLRYHIPTTKKCILIDGWNKTWMEIKSILKCNYDISAPLKLNVLGKIHHYSKLMQFVASNYNASDMTKIFNTHSVDSIEHHISYSLHRILFWQTVRLLNFVCSFHIQFVFKKKIHEQNVEYIHSTNLWLIIIFVFVNSLENLFMNAFVLLFVLGFDLEYKRMNWIRC